MSLEYRTRFSVAKEEAGEIETVIFITNMNTLEDQRNTSKVIITAPDGSAQEFVTEDGVEEVSAEENEVKIHQTEGWVVNY